MTSCSRTDGPGGHKIRKKDVIQENGPLSKTDLKGLGQWFIPQRVLSLLLMSDDGTVVVVKVTGVCGSKKTPKVG